MWEPPTTHGHVSRTHLTYSPASLSRLSKLYRRRALSHYHGRHMLCVWRHYALTAWRGNVQYVAGNVQYVAEFSNDFSPFSSHSPYKYLSSGSKCLYRTTLAAFMLTMGRMPCCVFFTKQGLMAGDKKHGVDLIALQQQQSWPALHAMISSALQAKKKSCVEILCNMSPMPIPNKAEKTHLLVQSHTVKLPEPLMS